MDTRSYLISAILFMKACPSQVVLAHSQLARIITNVFVVGYSVFKVQMKGILNYPFTYYQFESFSTTLFLKIFLFFFVLVLCFSKLHSDYNPLFQLFLLLIFRLKTSKIYDAEPQLIFHPYNHE